MTVMITVSSGKSGRVGHGRDEVVPKEKKYFIETLSFEEARMQLCSGTGGGGECGFFVRVGSKNSAIWGTGIEF